MSPSSHTESNKPTGSNQPNYDSCQFTLDGHKRLLTHLKTRGRDHVDYHRSFRGGSNSESSVICPSGGRYSTRAPHTLRDLSKLPGPQGEKSHIDEQLKSFADSKGLSLYACIKSNCPLHGISIINPSLHIPVEQRIETEHGKKNISEDNQTHFNPYLPSEYSKSGNGSAVPRAEAWFRLFNEDHIQAVKESLKELEIASDARDVTEDGSLSDAGKSIGELWEGISRVSRKIGLVGED